MNKMKSLGILTQEQKEDIWKNKMSGSQVKRIFSDAKNLWLEKTGEKEIVDLSKTKAQKFLQAGTYMEEHIIEMAKLSFDDLKDIKVTKETFASEEDDYFTANIDGYIGNDINNVDYIIEIKNTTCTSDTELLERYEKQIRYYSAMFNAEYGAYLVAFINGNELRKLFIERDREKELEIFTAINGFRDAVEMGLPPLEEKIADIVIDEAVDGLNDEMSQTIAKYNNLKEQEKEIKDQLSGLKTYIDSIYNETAKITLTTGYGINKIAQNKKTIDKDAIIHHLIEKHNEDLTKLLDEYTTYSTQYQIRTIKPKGGK